MGGRGSGRKRDPEKVRRALDLRTKGLTLAAIGVRLGLSRETVRKMLIASGHYQLRGKMGRPPKKEK